MATRNHRLSGKTADREIVISRLYDTPRELVFRAWTSPEHVRHWWGPNGFTTTTHEMDVKPDGIWRFIMHGPDGVDYKNKILFIEVVEPEHLVYAHGGDDEGNSPPFHVTVTFADLGGVTELTLRSLFVTAAQRDENVKFGAIEGGYQTLERLAAFLAKM